MKTDFTLEQSEEFCAAYNKVSEILQKVSVPKMQGMILINLLIVGTNQQTNKTSLRDQFIEALKEHIK